MFCFSFHHLIDPEMKIWVSLDRILVPLSWHVLQSVRDFSFSVAPTLRHSDSPMEQPYQEAAVPCNQGGALHR